MVLLLYNAVEGRVEDIVDRWIVRIRKEVPVVLIGTHIDRRARVLPEMPWSPEERERLLDGMADSSISAKVAPVLKKWMQVSSYLEVSAPYLVNLEMVFPVAVASVREPLTALTNPANGALTKAFRKALRRIFFLLDKDGDGRLSEAELTEYHAKALALEGDELKEAVRSTIAQLKKQLGDWSLGGATYQGFEAAFQDMLQSGHASIVWKVLQAYSYGRNLEVTIKTALDSLDLGVALSDPKRVRLTYTAEALLWIETMSRRASNVTNLKALLSLLPEDLVTNAEWPMDDIVSGDVVAVSGNGLPKPSWLALWFLLLESNDLPCAVRAELMARIWGFPERPFVTCAASVPRFCRVLVVGSGERTRSMVMRGAICGSQRKIDDQISSERIVFSCGKLVEHLYVCGFAPKRLPENFDRFDLAVVPFDVKEGDRAFLRAASWALLCSPHVPVIFACADMKTMSSSARDWMQARQVRCFDASDPEGLRRAIVNALGSPHDSMLAPVPGDVTVAVPKPGLSKEAQRPKDWFRILMVIVAISLLISPSWLSRATQGAIPSSALTFATSVVAAALIFRFVITA